MTRSWLRSMSRLFPGPEGYEARQMLVLLDEYDARRREEG